MTGISQCVQMHRMIDGGTAQQRIMKYRILSEQIDRLYIALICILT